MFKIIAQFTRLLRPCISAPGGRATLALFALALALNLGSVYASLRLTRWTGDFYSAIEKVNAPEVLRQIGIFAVIIALNSTRGLAHEYIRKVIEIRWRRSLTRYAIDLWTNNKAYWHLANAADTRIDNPDQRIAEDCRLFTKGVLGEALDLIGEIVGLFSYIALLWTLASFPLSLAFIGLDIEIPRYMIWAAFLYVAISSTITHVLGKPLKGLISEQQKREASFRFSMARWRTSFDEVALSGGEAAERRGFDQRFEAVAGNWKHLIRRELALGCFIYPFRHSVLRIPLFVALPGYLAGHVAFGGLMQLGMAFANVVTTLSWFIFSYRDLSDLVATSGRLDAFLRAAEAAGARHRSVCTDTDGEMRLENVVIRTPEGNTLITLGRLTVKPGEAIWLRGPSGIGKTTLVKTLAGLWPHAEGRIHWPKAATMFLPQKPYNPSGTISDAVAYPGIVRDFDRVKIDAALDEVGLSHLDPEKRVSDDDRSPGLSGGEMQRLALARLLLHQPQIAVLDEATSALDAQSEGRLFTLLRLSLPRTTFVIIAHRQPAGHDHLRTIDLQPDREQASINAIA